MKKDSEIHKSKYMDDDDDGGKKRKKRKNDDDSDISGSCMYIL